MTDYMSKHPSFRLLQNSVLQYVALTPMQRQAFEQWLIAGETFKYVPNGALTDELIRKRRQAIKTLKKLPAEGVDDTWSEWLRYKEEETDLLEAICQLPAAASADEYLRRNEVVYGAYDETLFRTCLSAILQEVRRHSRDTKMAQAVINMLGEHASLHTGDIAPSDAAFRYYKALAETYFVEVVRMIDEALVGLESPDLVSGEKIAEIIESLLRHIKATEKGWAVSLSQDIDKVVVNPKTKTVYVTTRGIYMSQNRLRGLLLHETMVHVVRHLGKTGFASLMPTFMPVSRRLEEGIGVLVEQLMLNQYHPLRVFRYIAIGLGIGVDGERRTAREVYEILWRLRYLTSTTTSIAMAQRFASLETMRVFRNVSPQIPGAVLLRDQVYMAGSAEIWKHLEKAFLPYNTFVELLQLSSKAE